MRNLGPYFPRRPNRLNGPLLTMLLNGVHDANAGRVFVVQVGAGSGQGDPNLLDRFRNDGWSGLLIEPQPTFFAELEALHAQSERVAVLNLGLSDVAGIATLYALSLEARERNPKVALNRASVIRDRILVPGIAEDDLEVAEIPVLRLDTVLGELGIDAAQVVVVNAGGHEAQVVRGFDLAALSADLVLVRIAPGTAAEGEVIARLEEAALLPFRLSNWLVGLKPGALSVPLDELLTFLQRGVGQPEDDPE
jgi:FkbM family methyltransferase